MDADRTLKTNVREGAIGKLLARWRFFSRIVVSHFLCVCTLNRLGSAPSLPRRVTVCLEEGSTSQNSYRRVRRKKAEKGFCVCVCDWC